MTKSKFTFPVGYHEFHKDKAFNTEAECGEAHCQLNNFPLSRQIMFDWIEDIRIGGGS